MIGTVNTSISPIRTATQRLTYFFRCGKKEVREGQLRQLFKRRALDVGKQDHNVAGQKTTELFQQFFLAATPFIGLKTRRRRRGKRVVIKLVPFSQNRGERRSFVRLSNALRVSGAVSKPFVDRLERELEVFALNSGSSTGVASGSSSNVIRDKRDEVHKLAYSARPYR